MHEMFQSLTVRLRHRGFVRRPSSDRGASLVEYALLIGLIAILCIVAITYFGGSTSQSFSKTSSSISLS